jgi:NitT/TauT family transport system ATP-binding protein
MGRIFDDRGNRRSASHGRKECMESGTTTLLVSHDLEEAVFLADRVLLLSRGPARIAAYPFYEAPRPRTGSTLSEPDFVALKSHCLEIFQREVRAKPQQ